MTAGDIYTVAGGSGPPPHPAGHGRAALTARISAGPVTLDGAGNLVFAGNHQIGVLPQRAGTWYGIAMKPGRVYGITGTPRWQGAVATRVSLPAGPAGVASDRSGDMSIGFLDHGPVFVPARTGTYFGVPMRAGHIYLIPGARPRLGLGTGEVAADRSGNVLIADQARNLVLVAPARPGRFYGRQMAVGHMYPVAGDGKAAASGNGGPARAAGFSPFQVTADRQGNIFIVGDPGDYTIRGDEIQMVAAHTGRFFGTPMKAGHIYTVAGYGSNAGHVADGVPATHSAMTPSGATIDRSGNLVLATDYRIRVVAERSGTFYRQAMKAGYIYTLAGPFPGAHSVATDSHGNILELDAVASVVRLYAAGSGTFYGQPVTAGHTYVVAGRWQGRASLGDGGPATLAWLGDPQDIATGPGGRLLIADTAGARIRAVSP